MRELHACLVCLCALIFISISGCGGQKPESVLVENSEKTVSTEKSIDLSSGITVGNHTYLPINIGGNPASHVHEILHILDAFEKEHQELELISWHIEKDQSAYTTSARIYGLWINHRLKK